MSLVVNLKDYNNQFTEHEMKSLDDCFRSIQDYLNETYISRGSLLKQYKYNIYSDIECRYSLVIDYQTKESYLKFTERKINNTIDIGNSYFYKKDTEENVKHLSQKYLMTYLIIKYWDVVKYHLERDLEREKSVSNLCSNFRV